MYRRREIEISQLRSSASRPAPALEDRCDKVWNPGTYACSVPYKSKRGPADYGLGFDLPFFFLAFLLIPTSFLYSFSPAPQSCPNPCRNFL